MPTSNGYDIKGKKLASKEKHVQFYFIQSMAKFILCSNLKEIEPFDTEPQSG